MMPVFTPLHANSPQSREYSIFGQRFMTTSRPAAAARSAAASLRTPICIHTTLAPAATASSVIGPAASELRKRSEEHTSELQSLMRISYAVFGLQKKNIKTEIY